VKNLPPLFITTEEPRIELTKKEKIEEGSGDFSNACVCGREPIRQSRNF